jgi:hypothetical protein
VRRHRLDQAVLRQDLPEFLPALMLILSVVLAEQREEARAGFDVAADAVVPLLGDRIAAPSLDLVELVELRRREGLRPSSRPSEIASPITSEPRICVRL